MTRLLDTSVLIAVIRRRPEALRWAHRNAERPFAVSAVSVLELHRGVRDGEDLAEAEAAIDGVQVIGLDGPIGAHAGAIMREYAAKIGLDVPDAIIAATAQIVRLPLLTLNLKHFPMLPDARRPF